MEHNADYRAPSRLREWWAWMWLDLRHHFGFALDQRVPEGEQND